MLIDNLLQGFWGTKAPLKSGLNPIENSSKISSINKSDASLNTTSVLLNEDYDDVSIDEDYNAVFNGTKDLLNRLSKIISSVLQKHDIERVFADQIPLDDFKEYAVYISEFDIEFDNQKFEFEVYTEISDFLTKMLDEPVSWDDIEVIADDPKNFASEYENNIPFSFRAAVEFDNIMWNNGERESSISLDLLRVYEMAGEMIIDIHDSSTNTNYYRFSEGMMTYIVDNSKLARNVLDKRYAISMKADRLTKISAAVSSILVEHSDITKKAADLMTIGDLVRYLMYLSASDERIKWKEAELISEWYGKTVMPNDIVAFLNDFDICSEKFEHTVPASIKAAVSWDNKEWLQGQRDEDSLALMLWNIYKEAGTELINVDGTKDDSEENDILNYLNVMMAYINDQDALVTLGKSHFDRSTIYKGGDFVKSGVSAPQKKRN